MCDPLTADDLVVGRVYRAKRPRRAGNLIFTLVNDREIKWRSTTHVQYDSPSVAVGRHYPTATLEEFLRWADRDVTDALGAGEWHPWPPRERERCTA